jgi:hypothetical protein
LEKPAVSLVIDTPPGRRLSVNVTDEFFVTPPSSSVVAEALAAANAIIAMAATAARPRIFRCFMCFSFQLRMNRISGYGESPSSHSGI